MRPFDVKEDLRPRKLIFTDLGSLRTLSQHRVFYQAAVKVIIYDWKKVSRAQFQQRTQLNHGKRRSKTNLKTDGHSPTVKQMRLFLLMRLLDRSLMDGNGLLWSFRTVKYLRL